MSHPDDYISSPTPFHGDETGEVFAVKDEQIHELELFDHSFETQSGFLVVVKPVGDRYSLSFKRQLGTPPASSVFLTLDEAARLANILGLHSFDSETPSLEEGFARRRATKRKKSNAWMFSIILFLVTVILCVVTGLIIYKLIPVS